MSPNPFDAIEEPVRDLHHDAGWAGRVYTDEFAGEGPTGTPQWDEDEEGTPATIRVEWPNQAQSRSAGAGAELEGDIAIHVDTEEVAVHDGTEGSETRASTIEDERNGVTYRVLRIRDEDYGIVTCDCERVDG